MVVTGTYLGVVGVALALAFVGAAPVALLGIALFGLAAIAITGVLRGAVGRSDLAPFE